MFTGFCDRDSELFGYIARAEFLELSDCQFPMKVS
jgi:hypothetical protein